MYLRWQSVQGSQPLEFVKTVINFVRLLLIKFLNERCWLVFLILIRAANKCPPNDESSRCFVIERRWCGVLAIEKEAKHVRLERLGELQRLARQRFFN